MRACGGFVLPASAPGLRTCPGPDPLADIQRRIWEFMERVAERLRAFVLASQPLRHAVVSFLSFVRDAN